MKNQFSKYGILKNKYLIGAILLGIVLQVIVVIIPAMAKIFEVTTLNSTQWIYTALISISPLVIIEIQKRINENKNQKECSYETLRNYSFK